LELISAYADGELTESEIKRVEEHLGSCESCSAILDLYREISVAAFESNVPAPDALCAGVMEKVLSENTEVPAGNANKSKIIRIALTRYLPVAACLAVMLITLPWVMNNYDRNTENSYLAPSAPGAAAPEMQMWAPAEAPMIMQDQIAEADSDDMDMARSGPAMAGGGAVMPVTPGWNESAAVRDSIDRGGEVRNDSPAAAMPAPAPAAPAAPAPAAPAPEPALLPQVPAPESQPAELTQTEDVNLPASAADRPAMEPEHGSDITEDNSPPDRIGARIYDILGDFHDAYAWIEITVIGSIPEILAGYDREPLDWLYPRQVFFKVPLDVAQVLIEEIRVRENLRVPIINENSKYAIVSIFNAGSVE